MLTLHRINKFKELVGFGSLFKTAYLIYALALFNNFTEKQSYVSKLAYIVAALGLFTLIIRFINYRKYLRTKYLIILAVFVLSYLLSTLVNLKYGFTENIQQLIWMVLIYGVIYACDFTVEPRKYYREFNFVAHLFLIYVFFCVIVGDVMLVHGYSYVSVVSGLKILRGVRWGRLWGVYADPNYAAVYASIAIVFCLYFLTKTKRLFYKILYIVNIMLQFMYIVFSDSRTGIVCFVVSLAFLGMMLNLKWNFLKSRSNMAVRFMSIFLFITISILGLIIYDGAKIGYNAVARSINAQLVTSVPSRNTVGENEYSGTKKPPITRSGSATNSILVSKSNVTVQPSTIGRPSYDESYHDVSDRRFAIWKSGLDLFKLKPITGITTRDMVSFARAELPNTFILKNDIGVFSNLQNGYFDVLVSQGIIGTITMLVLIVFVLSSLFKNVCLFKNDDYMYVIVLFTIVVTIGVSNFFISDIFYLNSPGTFFFWLLLGYLMHLIQARNPS